MTPDSEVLHEISNTAKPNRHADIVFIHGLGGTSHGTWTNGKKGRSEHFFWPVELGNDLPQCGIWTIGYPAGFTALGKPGMIIEKRAGNLSQKLVNAALGVRPLLFITHSMGGLVVKALIVGSQTLADADRKRLVSAVRGIVFCATPHRGSAFADAAGVLGKFLGGSQKHVDEMRANAEPLDILHDGFIEWQRKHPIPIESYAENIGLFRTRLWRRPLPLGLVVPRASANPGIAGHTVRDVDEDHLTLVKPTNRLHDVYAGVLRFVQTTLNPTTNAEKSIHCEPSNARAQAVESLISQSETAPLPKSVPFHADVSRIIKYAPAELIGREVETKILSDSWKRTVEGEPKRSHILTFVALGGEGKTSLIAKWVANLAYQEWPGCDTAFAWSFYSQGTREQNAVSSDLFLKEALI